MVPERAHKKNYCCLIYSKNMFFCSEWMRKKPYYLILPELYFQFKISDEISLSRKVFHTGC